MADHNLTYRVATVDDAPLIVQMNRQLIRDERARTRLNRRELEARLLTWMRNGYTAVIFEVGGATAGYALYRMESANAAYIQHFFVAREFRRQGVGRAAMQILLTEVLPRHAHVTLDVLVHNRRGRRFWEAVGFKPWSMRMELQREDLGPRP